MNPIGQAHRALARLAPQFSIDVLAGSDLQTTIRRDIQLVAPQRESPLHPSLVVWLTLAMALFRADSIPNVFARLLTRWRESKPWLSFRAVTDGALAHARRRLGALPLRRLFEEISKRVAPEPSFHGLRVWSLDGTVLAAADTPANERAFGRHHASKGRSAFPQLRLLTLTAARTHEIRDVHWGPYRQSEASMAADVVRNLRKGDLVLMDRGFMSMHFYAHLAQNDVVFVSRVRNTRKMRVLACRGPGDYEVEVKGARPTDPKDHRGRCTMILRLIEYRIGHEWVRLLTNLTDASISGREIAELYHERWEVELVFDELKTHIVSVRHGTLDLPFRGKSPEMVEQELWATLAAFNLVRREIAGAARLHRIDPRRISFTDALVVIVATWRVGSRSKADRRRAHARLLDDLAACELDRWRRPRKCPRVVRVRSNTYPHKGPMYREEFHDASQLIRMGDSRCA